MLVNIHGVLNFKIVKHGVHILYISKYGFRISKPFYTESVYVKLHIIRHPFYLGYHRCPFRRCLSTRNAFIGNDTQINTDLHGFSTL